MLLANVNVLSAQVSNDSLADDFRTLAARNFSRYRTVNFSWEAKGAHDYTFSLDGSEVEKGRKRNIHTLNFSTMVPLVKSSKLSLYANVKYASYNFECSGNAASGIFLDDTYDHYAGGINGSYYARLFNRPLILSADVFVDGWKKGWGKLQGRFAAVVLLKNDASTSVSVGMMGMTLYSSTPVMPIVTYWHRFANPNLSVDITLPSQMYMRYQMRNQRVSVGAAMSADEFYLRPVIGERVQTYLYKEAVMKPEIHYEYIISRQFYVSAHAGVSMALKGGLYDKNRKEMKVAAAEPGASNGTATGAMMKQDHSPVPFFNVGVSYSLFK